MQKTKIESFKNILAGIGAVALLIISLVVATNPKGAGEDLAALVLGGSSRSSLSKTVNKLASSASSISSTGESECGFLQQWKVGEENAGPFSMVMGADKKMYIVSTGAKNISIGGTVFTQYKDNGKLTSFISPRDIALTSSNGKDYLLVTDYGDSSTTGKVLSLTVSGVDLILDESWDYGDTNESGFNPTHIIQYGSPELFLVVDDFIGKVYEVVITDKSGSLLEKVKDSPLPATPRIGKSQGTIAGIAVAGANMYLTVSGATNKIHSYNISTKKYYKSYEKQGSKEGELGIVSDISFADGKLFVSDIQKGSFVVFSLELNYLFTMEDYYGAHDPNNPNGNGIQFKDVSNLYYGPDGYLYATSYRIENGIKVYYVSKIGLDCVNINIIKTFPNLPKNSDIFKFTTGVNFYSALPRMVPPAFDLPTLGSYKKDLTVRYLSGSSVGQGKYFFNEEPIYWQKGPGGDFYKDKNGNKIEKYNAYWKCVYIDAQKTVKTTAGTGYRIEVIPTKKDQTIDCFVSNYQKGLRVTHLEVTKDVIPGESDEVFNFDLSSIFDTEEFTLVDDGGTHKKPGDDKDYPNNIIALSIMERVDHILKEKVDMLQPPGSPYGNPYPKWHTTMHCSYYNKYNELYKVNLTKDLKFDTQKRTGSYELDVIGEEKDRIVCKVSNCLNQPPTATIAGEIACKPDLKDDATIRVEKHYFSPVLDGGQKGGEHTEVPFNFSITEPNKLVTPKDFELKDNGQSGKNIYEVKVPGGLIYTLEEKIDVNKLTKYEDRLPPMKTIVSYYCLIQDKSGSQVGFPKTGKGTKVNLPLPPGGKALCKFHNCPGDPLKKEDVDACESYVAKTAKLEIIKEYEPGNSPDGLYFKFNLTAEGQGIGNTALDDDGSSTPYPKSIIVDVPGNINYNIFENAFRLIGGKEFEDKENIYTFICTTYNPAGKFLERKTSFNKFITVKTPVGGKTKCIAYNCTGDPTNPEDIKRCQASWQLTGGDDTSLTGGGGGGTGGGGEY